MLSSKAEAGSSVSPGSVGSSRKRSRLDELIDVLGVSVHSTKSSVHLTSHLSNRAEAEHLSVRSGSSSGTGTGTGASEKFKSSNNSAATRQLRLQPLRRPQPFNAMSEPLTTSMTAAVPLAIGGCRQCRRTFAARLEFIHHMVDHFPALFYSFEPMSLKFDQCSSPPAFQNSSLDFNRNELIKSVPMSLSTAILPLAPLSPKTTASIGISR
ncbi:unnamed protein product [Anisakis simplex]|uniref:C2H2-type domain-containing protein n=1 Tax=Anisakis simplex TaxID=6269 RepID=A0A0M3K801_ANISI|nr:unnamed protein product [Anisakis simplex]